MFAVKKHIFDDLRGAGIAVAYRQPKSRLPGVCVAVRR
jgi:hypothetical protein